REYVLCALLAQHKHPAPATDRPAGDGESVERRLRDPPAAATRLRLVDGVGDESHDRPGGEPRDVGANPKDDCQDGECAEPRRHESDHDRPVAPADHRKRTVLTTTDAVGSTASMVVSAGGAVGVLSALSCAV